MDTMPDSDFRWGSADDFVSFRIVPPASVDGEDAQVSLYVDIEAKVGNTYSRHTFLKALSQVLMVNRLREHFGGYYDKHDVMAHRQDTDYIARRALGCPCQEEGFLRYGFTHVTEPVTDEGIAVITDILKRRTDLGSSRELSIHALSRVGWSGHALTALAETAIYPYLSLSDAVTLHRTIRTLTVTPSQVRQLSVMLHYDRRLPRGYLPRGYTDWITLLAYSDVFKVNPRWQTDHVRQLATMVSMGYSDRVGILADALLDADCDDEDLLRVLRLPSQYWAFGGALMRDLAVSPERDCRSNAKRER